MYDRQPFVIHGEENGRKYKYILFFLKIIHQVKS